tara:strand:+ start:39 stop:476 length:438 start_codon:yes stop_codon:yes gene_type:complete
VSKKKSYFTPKDKKDWFSFVKNMGNPQNKDLENHNINKKKNKTIDLHGSSLEEANKKIKDLINFSFENNYDKILVITGKGIRSKKNIEKNPYLSNEMSQLKYSVPNYIENDEELSDKIYKISKAEFKDGGEGAFYIFLKKLKNKF